MSTITTELPFKGVMTSFIGGRAENQDTCGSTETSRGLLVVVCDGMGGGPAGKTASSLAVATIFAYFQNTDALSEEEKTADDATFLRAAVCKANKALRDKIAEVPACDGMGTTVVAVLLKDGKATIAHVGDSRVYQLRKRKFVFRTADHSLVAEMVRSGKLNEEQARTSANSNIITRALGVKDEVEVDIDSETYQKGDRFVLCTDGVWGSMPQNDLVKMFTEDKSIDTTVSKVNTAVENAGRDKGGKHDNYTQIIVDCLGETPAATDGEADKSIAPVDARKQRVKRLIFVFALLAVVIAWGAFYFVNNPIGTDEEKPINTETPAPEDTTKKEEKANPDEGAKQIEGTQEVKEEMKKEDGAAETKETGKGTDGVQTDTNGSPAASAILEQTENVKTDASNPQEVAPKESTDTANTVIGKLNGVVESLNNLSNEFKAGKSVEEMEPQIKEVKECLISLQTGYWNFFNEDERMLLFSKRKVNKKYGALSAMDDTKLNEGGALEIILGEVNDAIKSIKERKNK